MEPAYLPISLIQNTGIGNINVCINKSKDLPTDMSERTTTLFISETIFVSGSY